MKFICGVSFLMFLFSAPDKTPRQLFDDFHVIYKNRDFKSMDTLLSAGFVGLNENGSIGFTKPEYIAYMKSWNRVFNTKWNVDTIEVYGDEILSLEYDTDEYSDYFYGGKHPIRYLYKFEGNKIKSITTYSTKEGLKAEGVFDQRFSEFCSWVKDRYPEKLRYCSAVYSVAATEIKKLLAEYLLSKKREA